MRRRQLGEPSPAVERQDREHGAHELHGRASAARAGRGPEVAAAALGELPELLGDAAGEH